MAQTTSILGGGVTINEIGTSPGPSQDINGDAFGGFADQYFELVNTSGGTIDISGWQIYERDVVVHTFAAGTSLTTGARITVVDGQDTTNAIVNVTGTAVYTDPNGDGSTADAVNITPSNLDVLALVNAGPPAQYILLQGSAASGTTLTNTINQILADHPGATQIGTTEAFGPNAQGVSMQRPGDGEDSWVAGTPTPGGANVSCFAAGTWIATPTCERLVQDLAPGDLVLTADGRSVAVRFNLRQSVQMRTIIPQRLEPVRIRAGALGGGTPHSDLILTADHGMIVDGLLINAAALVNGTTIAFVSHVELPDRVTYYHIETADHDVILANGAPAETFVDYAGRQGFDNYQQYLDLYGCEPILPEMDRPRISAQRLVPQQIRDRLGIAEEGVDFDDLIDWDIERCA